MTHYVCPKCGGVSDAPKVCETAGCAGEHMPLHECHCDGMQHTEVKDEQK